MENDLTLLAVASSETKWAKAHVAKCFCVLLTQSIVDAGFWSAEVKCTLTDTHSLYCTTHDVHFHPIDGELSNAAV